MIIVGKATDIKKLCQDIKAGKYDSFENVPVSIPVTVGVRFDERGNYSVFTADEKPNGATLKTKII